MNLLLVGPPGSGKGTQSQQLIKKHGLVHLSTGDMFRAAIQNQTEVGLKAKAYMDRGEYVPDHVVIDLIQHRLEQADISNGFILDGFPRTVPQAEALSELLQKLNKKLDAVFYFSVKKEELVKRLSSRQTCRNCGRVVSQDQLAVEVNKTCVKTKHACDFYQREDDRAEVVAKRIEVYESQTTPVLDYYRKNHSHFVMLNGAESPAEVFQKIEQTLAQLT